MVRLRWNPPTENRNKAATATIRSPGLRSRSSNAFSVFIIVIGPANLSKVEDGPPHGAARKVGQISFPEIKAIILVSASICAAEASVSIK